MIPSAQPSRSNSADEKRKIHLQLFSPRSRGDNGEDPYPPQRVVGGAIQAVRVVIAYVALFIVALVGYFLTVVLPWFLKVVVPMAWP